jgi:hypothetical protein
MASATVSVRLNGVVRGSGFFAAPGIVLTCAHVVGEGAGTRVVVDWAGQSYQGVVVHACPVEPAGGALHPPPDIAIVRLEDAPPHPCAVLDRSPLELDDQVLVHGVGLVFGTGVESELFRVTGRIRTGTEEIVKLGLGQAVPGMSGSPVLNVRTGAVAGLLRTSRDVRSALGALVVPSPRVLEELRAARPAVAVPEPDPEWLRRAEDWPGLIGDVLTPPGRLPDPCPPSLLLRSDYDVTPFFGRTELIDRFAVWQDQPGHVAISVITARGGEGKTRLALELCRAATARGAAIAGFLRRDAPATALARLRTVNANVLIVIDYAESREAELLRLCAEIAEPGEHHVRLLLLARSAEDWPERLRERGPDSVALLLEAAPFWQLPPLAGTPEDRQTLWAQAAGAFAERLGLPHPASPAVLAHSHALTLCMDALGTVLDDADEVPRLASGEPSTRLLDHEARYWRSTALAAELPDSYATLLADIVCAVTLGAADDRAEARTLLTAVPEFPASHFDRYSTWLRSLYPGEQWLNPLEPDRLGEDHVARCLGARPLLLDALLTVASVRQTRRIWIVLARAAARHPQLAELLADTVSADVVGRLGAAVAGAIDGGEPAVVVPILETTLPAVTDPLALADVERRIPEGSLALGDVALKLAERAVELAAELPAAERAELIGRYAMRLSSARRYDEAFEQTDLALGIHRRLAAGNPAANIPLAKALREMSIRLGNVGRAGEAVEFARDAVRLYTTLAADGDADRKLELAKCLNNLAVRLAAVGEDALETIQEAVRIKREVAGDVAADLASLALSLNNLAVRLARSGDREGALQAIAESVALRRELADRYPDVYLPGLALSLNNQAAYVGSADPGRALDLVREAADIRERLAYLAPARYEHAFAVSLNNLSARLSDVGQHGAALDAVDRAITLKRATAGTTPREVDSLATSLMRRSKCLMALGRFGEALRDAEAAVVARESLPDSPHNRDALQRARTRRAEVIEAMAQS